ncbi:putative sulfate/molybdate transporter [Shewanella intestini]|uniref:Sulfate transporter n=1 Tax=Shewanella intestini TaxID=2017544 RepID=A0ABS5HYL8_9GAMM|nr:MULTISPECIES: putative sulfate/molybdate transporter [Shewanella]MBR9726887.1 sulfate transporter [Shewanella intestini]MRG34547.1 sulfate transporter [Shewanella sp. XMDDZSB0408]
MRCQQHQLRHINTFSGEISGAFADLGTFLPLVLGLIALNQFSPQGVFLGFGCFALFTAWFYKRPIPTQPMKVISALVIAEGFSPGMLQASAMLIGIILLVLAYTGAIGWLAKQISPTISIGIQLAIGLQLIWIGGVMISETWVIGIAGLVLLLCSRFLPLPFLMMPAVLGLGIVWQMVHGAQASFEFNQVYPWHLSWPNVDEWSQAALLLVLPQLALTLTNAVIVVSALATSKFPEDEAKLVPKRFAISSGWANLLLAPFGGMAMCHGAGGFAVQYYFGARSYVAPLIFGVTCIAIALCWGQGMANLLSLIPMALLGALLAIAGIQLAWSKRFIDGKPYCIFVIFTTALMCLLFNTAVGLIAGLLLEFIRRHQLTKTT